MSAPRRLLSIATLVVASLLSACGGGRSSPGEALDSLRAAMSARDGVRAFELHDVDSRAFHLQRIRTVRARLEGGEPDQDVLVFDDQSREMFLDGTPEDVAGRIMLSHSELLSSWEWLRDATVLEEEIEGELDGQLRARMRLRGSDGVESEIFFIEEPEGWAYDQFRLRQEQLR